MELTDEDFPDWPNKKGMWDEDNSDDFMAESLKEAEDEVKKNKGEQVGLAQQIRKLDDESTVKDTDAPDDFRSMKK